MLYKEGAGEFFAQYIEFFAKERAYWLSLTIIMFIGTINKLISFCINQEDRRLSLEQQSHKDESLTACFFFFLPLVLVGLMYLDFSM